MHLLLTEGGLSLEGTRWVQPYNLGWLRDHAGLKKMWKYHVVSVFREAHKYGELRFRASAGFLKAYPCFNAMLGGLWQLTWYAHIGACLLDPSATLRYIGRLVRHIPDKHFKMVRYAGVFAPRWKRRYLEQARRALGHDWPVAADPEAIAEEPVSLRTWRERRQAQTGIDPLSCSHCGRSMRLWDVAFGPHARIERLFRLAGQPVRSLRLALPMPP